MKRLLALAVVLLVSACGIKPTGVVPAGPAPTLRNPASSGRGTDVILYFVIDGRATPVTRPNRGGADVGTALSMLLDGPSYAEQAEGFVTMLPAKGGQVGLSPGPRTVISVAFPVKQLNPTAVNQLVCTAQAALAVDSTLPAEGGITVAGSDAELPPQTCQAY